MKAKINDTEIYFDVAGTQMKPDTNILKEMPVLFLIHKEPGSNRIHYKYDSIELKKAQLIQLFSQLRYNRSKK